MKISPELLDRFGIPRISSLSFIDDLTGLPNRRFLRTVLDTLITGGGPFSVLFMDLDDFKQVNDTLGHDEGDRLLKRLASLLGSTMRERDLVARYGGDEFVLIAADGGVEQAVRVADKIISAVDGELRPKWGVSASIGIASYPEHARTISDLISMADNAMYSAKSSGKSCWRVSSPEGSSVFWHEDVFMARNREVDRLVSGLQPGKRNSLIIVSGETGSGKSSLLNAVSDRLSDTRIMRMECRPELTAVPWAAFATAIRRSIPEFPPPDLPPLWNNLLGRLMPDIFGESDLMSGSLDKLALLDAFASLLRAWTPLVLMIENVQWMDRETSGMLSYALQPGVTDGLAVCAALTVSSEGAGTEAIDILRGVEVADEMRLEPLSAFQVAELIKGRIGVLKGIGELADAVYRFSGGNPLFACEYLRSQLNSGMLRIEDGRLQQFPVSGAVPDLIRHIVGRKLGLLSQDSRRMLQCASVMRREAIELDLLRLISGKTEGELLSALDDGRTHGILRTTARDAMSFSFTNEAFREEVYRSAGRIILDRSHSVIAERRLYEEDFLNAGYHLEKSRRTLEALETFRKGAEVYLRSGLPTAAVSCLERADRLSLLLSESELPQRKLCDLKSELFNAYRCAGDWDRTREIACRHAEIAGSLGMRDRANSSRIHAADCLRMMSRYEDALEELSVLEEELTGHSLADCLIRAADSLSRIGRASEAADKLSIAETILDSGQDRADSLKTDLLHQKLVLAIANESFDYGVELADELHALSKSTPEYPWWYFYDVAETHLLAGKPRKARIVFEEGSERAMHQAALHGRMVLLAEMADACYHALDLSASETLLDEVEELAHRFGETRVLDDACLLRIELSIESGQIGLARSMMTELLCRRPENPAIAAINSFLLEREDDIKSSRQEVLRAYRLLAGKSMTSIIDTSVLITLDELRLQEAWTSARLEDTNWESVIRNMMPGLNARAAFRAAGLHAKWLHQKGRTEEADRVIMLALDRPEWSEMSLTRHRNLMIRAEWHKQASAEAESLLERSGDL